MRILVKSVFVLLLTTITLFTTTAIAKKIGGVELAPRLTVGSQELTLNGAGIRKKLFIKLYVGSLYLSISSNDANAIVNADEPMLIRLNILSDLLTRRKMLGALKDGFNSSTGGNTAPIQTEIDQLYELMQEKIRPGDVYTLAYQPGGPSTSAGTHILRNGTELSIINGLPFKKALFGIWLADKPVQATLKKAMLGN